MRKFTVYFLAFVLVLNLAGCGMKTEEKDVYRTDTVIYIPAEPTEPDTKPATETEEETTEMAESETTEETVPETTKAATVRKRLRFIFHSPLVLFWVRKVSNSPPRGAETL